MLVLSRRREESVVIRVGNTDIRIQIIDCDSRRVRLGIQAPRQIPIFRAELIDHPLPDRVEKKA